MTGLEVLIKDVCPYMLAEWLNRIDSAGVFHGEYIQRLEDGCRQGAISCRECWDRFFETEVPSDE